MSATGRDAAEARRRANSSIGYYNLKLGPVGLRFQGGMGVTYNDNVRYRSDNAESDLILRPQLTTRILWPVTENNRLNLAIGLGYSKYLSHSDLDRLFIRPGSEIAFDLYVGDFLFNIHDRFSIPMSVYEVPTVSGRGDYQRLENVVGFTGNWDLNKILVSFGYDHADYVSLNSTYQFSDGQSEMFFARGGLRLSSTTSGGVEFGSTLVNYANEILTDGVQYSVGLFYGGQISRYMQVKAMAGYTLYVQSPTTMAPDVGNSGAVYGQLVLDHRLNRILNYSLSAGRSIQLGLQYGTSLRNLDLTFIRLNMNWNWVRDTRISTPLAFEYGTESGSGSETFYRLGAGLSMGRMLTDKLSASLGYQFYWKDSQTNLRDYMVNSVSLNFGYNF